VGTKSARPTRPIDVSQEDRRGSQSCVVPRPFAMALPARLLLTQMPPTVFAATRPCHYRNSTGNIQLQRASGSTGRSVYSPKQSEGGRAASQLVLPHHWQEPAPLGRRSLRVRPQAALGTASEQVDGFYSASTANHDVSGATAYQLIEAGLLGSTETPSPSQCQMALRNLGKLPLPPSRLPKRGGRIELPKVVQFRVCGKPA